MLTANTATFRRQYGYLFSVIIRNAPPPTRLFISSPSRRIYQRTIECDRAPAEASVAAVRVLGAYHGS
jgi:hypothetical protein